MGYRLRTKNTPAKFFVPCILIAALATAASFIACIFTDTPWPGFAALPAGWSPSDVLYASSIEASLLAFQAWKLMKPAKAMSRPPAEAPAMIPAMVSSTTCAKGVRSGVRSEMTERVNRVMRSGKQKIIGNK